MGTKFIKIGDTIFKKDSILSIKFDSFEYEKTISYKALVEIETTHNAYATVIDINKNDMEKIIKEMLE